MVERIPIHRRGIETQGYLREDGLWDIEGCLRDFKGYAFENEDRGVIEPDEPLHDMFLRLTVNDDYEIVAVHAETRSAPFRLCPNITENYQKLVGLRIQAGFSREARRLVGGVMGCTHISEILRILTTVAMQTIRHSSKEFLQKREKDAVLAQGSFRFPSALKNTCHVFDEDNSVVAQRAFAKTPREKEE